MGDASSKKTIGWGRSFVLSLESWIIGIILSLPWILAFDAITNPGGSQTFLVPFSQNNLLNSLLNSLVKLVSPFLRIEDILRFLAVGPNHPSRYIVSILCYEYFSIFGVTFFICLFLVFVSRITPIVRNSLKEAGS